MTLYINTITFEYPMTELQVRQAASNTSFATPFVPPSGYEPVVEVSLPTYNSVTQKVVELTPTKVGSVWKQKWSVVTMTAEEAAVELKRVGDVLIRDVQIHVQESLDNFAKTRGYDNIISACTYVTSSVPQFATEAQRCVHLRDLIWGTCYQILGEVQAGTRPMPTFAAVIAELPALTWS